MFYMVGSMPAAPASPTSPGWSVHAPATETGQPLAARQAPPPETRGVSPQETPRVWDIQFSLAALAYRAAFVMARAAARLAQPPMERPNDPQD
jgi:hypothetical protein